jgi:hypothetical protein
MTVKLQDFWVSHESDYFLGFNGDVTKSFLINLANQVTENKESNTVYTSVYRRTSIQERIRNKISLKEESSLNKLYAKDFSSKPIPNHFNIWYTAENIRPPLEQNFDAFLSFDLDTYEGSNFYLPLWLCRLGPTIETAIEMQYSLTKKRKVGNPRAFNFCMVASNPEQIRNYFISRLKKYVDVSVYGKLGRPVKNKNATLQNYNFNICFENDLYPGYVTEKAIEAYMSGCIPVWRGDDAGEFLNSEAIINVSGLSVSGAIERVIKVSADLELVQHMREQPLLKKTIPIESIISDLKNIYQSR